MALLPDTDSQSECVASNGGVATLVGTEYIICIRLVR
jgi:hypothetical protein